MSTVVTQQSLRENYNSVLEQLGSEAFGAALNYFENVVDEFGAKHNINFEDICNMVTNASQAARRDYVAKSNQSAS